MEVKTNKAASHRIAGQLRTEILSGQRPPGTRIRQEVIAEEFGVSRLPIREALRILESHGLVTLVASTGAWVSTMSLDQCQERYLIRERLEPLLLGRAVGKYNGAELEHMQCLVEKMELVAQRAGSPEHIGELVELDREFHLSSYEAAGMPDLQATVVRLWNTTQPYRRAYVQLTWSSELADTFLEHRLLLSAFKTGDAQSAEQLISLHIRKTRIQLEHHPEIFSAK